MVVDVVAGCRSFLFSVTTFDAYAHIIVGLLRVKEVFGSFARNGTP